MLVSDGLSGASIEARTVAVALSDQLGAVLVLDDPSNHSHLDHNAQGALTWPTWSSSWA